MSSSVDVACPNCDKRLKVPASAVGKRVKCKACDAAFVVPDPDEAKPTKPAKPAKPGARAAAASPPPPPPPAAPAKHDPFADDEDVLKPELIEDEEIPRCPACAKELDPPDAKVCIHCGFNNLTRAKAETKKTWAPSTEDWIMHLLPGIIAAIICISLIVWAIIVYLKMRGWMVDSFLELDEEDATGKKKNIVPPGFFICLNLVICLAIFVPSVKLAIRRLVKEFTPPEQIKT